MTFFLRITTAYGVNSKINYFLITLKSLLQNFKDISPSLPRYLKSLFQIPQLDEMIPNMQTVFSDPDVLILTHLSL